MIIPRPQRETEREKGRKRKEGKGSSLRETEIVENSNLSRLHHDPVLLVRQ